MSRAAPAPFVVSLLRWIVRHPRTVLLVCLALLLACCAGLTRFRLDASSDSLVLEQDEDLRVYDDTRVVFGTDSTLIVVARPEAPLFAPGTIERIEALSSDLEELQGIEGVLSITRAPLFRSPPTGLFRLAEGFRTLSEEGVDPQSARDELLENPLTAGALLDRDLETTALQLTLSTEQRLMELEQRRYELRDLEDRGELDQEQREELERIERAFRAETQAAADRRRELVADVREVLERHRNELGRLELGGLPMISVDIVRYIERDMVVFGVASVLFVVLAVMMLLRSAAWTAAISLHCTLSVLAVLGVLGWMDWRVTVVTSNLSSLLFIMTLAMAMHIAIRTREESLRSEGESGTARWPGSLESGLGHVFVPCLFTVLTTMVGFASLYLSRIRPVMDFALMMALGLAVVLVTSFTLLPSLVLVLSGEGGPKRPRTLGTRDRYRRTARWAIRRRRGVVLVTLVLVVASAAGITRLSVENSFVDYFRDSSQIHRGLTLIDRELGGTTPLEIVLEADTADAWLDMESLESLGELHRWLEEQPEIGHVASLHSLVQILEQVIAADPNPAMRSAEVNTFLLRTIRSRVPAEVARSALRPYVSADYSSTRIVTRVEESTPDLDRSALLQRVRERLEEEPVTGAEGQFVTGMFVLYNNMIESLFRSQVSTLVAVLAAVVVMFLLLLRSLRLALLALVPNVLPVCVVLAVLGWLGIPLDMMTIMIAAITLGISVDDTVHYLYRYRSERRGDLSRSAAIARGHDTVGRAMLATTVAVTFGFSILALSNFKPTINFGLLTGLAMITALAADALLLPALLTARSGDDGEGAAP